MSRAWKLSILLLAVALLTMAAMVGVVNAQSGSPGTAPPAADWLLIGDAERTDSGSVALTSGSWQVGGLFYPQLLTSRNLRVEFSFEITGDGTAADGIALVAAQNLPNDELANRSVAGGRLGSDMFTQAIAVEFDTFQNSWDDSVNHVGLSLMGTDITDFPLALSAVDLDHSLRNSGVYEAEIVLEERTFEVYLSDDEQGMLRDLLASYTIPPIISLDDYTDQYYIGLVGTTGTNTDRHIIHDVHLEVDGVAVSQSAAPPTATPAPTGRQSDRAVLEALYNATGGQSWEDTARENWLSGKPIGEWAGVTVVEGRVTGLRLSNSGLRSSRLPAELGNLGKLQVLDLSNNFLGGKIPEEWGNLSELHSVKLGGNRSSLCLARGLMTGNSPLLALLSLPGVDPLRFCALPEHPEERAALVALYEKTGGPDEEWKDDTNWSSNAPLDEWYGVTVDQITGRVAKLELRYNGLNNDGISNSLAMLGRLTSLTHLDLSVNDLGGALPPELDLLTDLTHLDLSDNAFRGDISQRNDGHERGINWGNLSKLESLDLSANKGWSAWPFDTDRHGLSGHIPQALWLLPNLTHLNLSRNELSNEITLALPRAGSNLNYVNLADNSLSGNIPASTGQLSKLTHLDLSRNDLSGTIPPNLGLLSELAHLDLSSNKHCVSWLFGSFCSDGLEGPIPPEFSGLRELTYLDVSGNRQTGGIQHLLPVLENEYDDLPERELRLDDNPWEGVDASVWEDFNGKIKAMAWGKAQGKLEGQAIGLAGRFVNSALVDDAAKISAGVVLSRGTARLVLRAVPVVGHGVTAIEWGNYLFFGGDNPYKDYIDLADLAFDALEEAILDNFYLNMREREAEWIDCMFDNIGGDMSHCDLLVQ